MTQARGEGGGGRVYMRGLVALWENLGGSILLLESASCVITHTTPRPPPLTPPPHPPPPPLEQPAIIQ